VALPADNRHLARLLETELSQDSNVVDAGAGDGRFLELAVRHAPKGRHVAFEPLPELAAALRAQHPAVDVRESALHDVSGRRSFYRLVEDPGRSSLEPADAAQHEVETLSVRVERLDDALAADYRPALIKIDVEGAEAGVLEGGIETLRRHRPLVILQHGVHSAHLAQVDIFSLLTDRAGLRVYDLDGGEPYDRDGFAERVRRGDSSTFVART
jgi:FkbM family methyltransferase